MDKLFKTVQISEISGASSKVVKLKEPPKRRWPQNPQSTRNPSIRQRTIKVGSLFPASSAAHIVHNQMPLPGSRRFSSFCHSIQVAHDCFYSINATKSSSLNSENNRTNTMIINDKTNLDILVYSKQANIYSLQSICVLWLRRRETPRKSRHNDWRYLLMDSCRRNLPSQKNSRT